MVVSGEKSIEGEGICEGGKPIRDGDQLELLLCHVAKLNGLQRQIGSSKAGAPKVLL